MLEKTMFFEYINRAISTRRLVKIILCVQIVPCVSSEHYILFARFLMARFLLVSGAFRENRSNCARLLFFLLAGSLAGALWSKLCWGETAFLASNASAPGRASMTLRALLFPCLMVVSYLIGRRFLFYVLFFMKGALCAFTLCLLCAQNVIQLSGAVWALLLQSLLSLPAQLLTGSLWLEAREAEGLRLLLFVPMTLFALLGVLLQSLL